MNEMTIREARRPLRRELCALQRGILGLLLLSTAWNMVQTARIFRLDAESRETAAQLEQAERTKKAALEQLGSLSLQVEADKQARMEQATAFADIGAYTYIGECTITAYCPCAVCCGSWAYGLTATGIPAAPGIVAVDPEIIPLGSTIIIDGLRYLAADTGVTGQAVDVCMESHQAADAFGVRTEKVWVVTG